MLIRRRDTELIEIKRFTYRHEKYETFCRVVPRVKLRVPSLVIEAADPNLPFIGVADGLLSIVTAVPVGPGDRNRVFKVVLSPQCLFKALDFELARFPFPEDADVVTLDVGIDAEALIDGTIARQLQLGQRGTTIEVETAAAVERSANAVPRRLRAVELLKLRRADGTYSRNDLVAPVPTGALEAMTRIEIHAGASQRFTREAILAFKIDACPGEQFVVYARLTAPALGKAADFRDTIVLCRSTSVPLDGEQGWELKRLSSLADVDNTVLYRLSAAHTYVVCLELSKLDFEIERLLPDERGPLVIGIELSSSPEPTTAPWERCQLEVRLRPSVEPLLLVSTTLGHRAVAVEVKPRLENTELRVSLLQSDSLTTANTIAVLVRNLSPEAVRCRYAASGKPGQIELARAERRQIDLDKIRDGEAWLMLAHTRLTFEKLAPTVARIVALDIGTMAMSMADGSAHDDDTQIIKLGELVRARVPNAVNRREADLNDLISAACGVTVSRPRRPALPTEATDKGQTVDWQPRHPILPTLVEFDSRLSSWLPTGNHRSDLLDRLCKTRAPLEMHLPLIDRGHESSSQSDIRDRGFASVLSVKTQICAYRSLLDHSDFLTFATRLEKPRVVEEMLLQDVDTQMLLAAVLDALLFGYGPAGIYDVRAARQDWDFVLTYPASVGAEVRQRYRDAIQYVVNRRQDTFDENSVAPQGSRGRVQPRLVPEAVAVCWALLNSEKLRPNQPGRLRRLIVFDIGAGTFDVSAFEIQPGKQADIVCQTVCFSVPLGGDVLDWAIAQDLLNNDETDRFFSTNVVTPDLLRRIESGKRAMTSHPCFGTQFLPIDLSSLAVGARPGKHDRFEGPRPDTFRFLPTENRDPITWLIVDLEDKSHNLHLQDYKRIVSQSLVAATLRTSGRIDDALVDVDVVISGRAGFFAPLRDAIQGGVASVNRRLKVRLACEILLDPDPTRALRPADADLMKGLVAKGAVAWARHCGDRDDSKTIEQPPRWYHVLSSYAILDGNWDSCLSHFDEPLLLEDFRVGSSRYVANQDMFLVTRPPFLAAHVYADAHPKLIARCLRPIALKDAPGSVPEGSSVPCRPIDFDPDAPRDKQLDEEILQSIRLARAGDTVELTCDVEEGDVVLLATVNGRHRGRWRLSSTFMT